MDLNDFVVLPNNKAKSVKHNARDLQDLQVETATLAKDSTEMEEKLQQLKERMSKEKMERGNYQGFRWKSGQCGSLKNANNATKNKSNILQQLSAGKVKIRVVKDEPLTAPPQPPPPLQQPAIGPQATRKNRLRGKICGQVKTAGLADLQTHLTTTIGSNCCPSASSNPNSSYKCGTDPNHNFTPNSSTAHEDQCSGKEAEAVVKPKQFYHDSQVLLMNHTGNMQKVTEERPKSGLRRECTDSLLKGEYNEEESARSFQEALRQWREENTDDAGETMSKEAMWIPVQPVLVSATATQTDLTSDEVAKGRGSRKGAVRVPVKLEFPEKCLTYTDRLLVKKLCRTPLETCLPLPAFGSDSKPEPDTNTVEGIESDLTAEEEEDFTRYFASLFAVPVSSGRNETLITTPETSLIIEVLDEIEEDKDGAFVSEKGTDSKRKYPSGQQALNDGNTQVPQTARALSSKNKPSSCPTAATPRTSEKSIKTPTSKSRKPSCSPIVHKSEPDCGSQQLVSSFSLPNCQTVTPKSSHFTASFLPDVSPSASATPPIPKELLSRCSSIPSSLRSTYTVSPSSSTESTLLPTVYQSATLEKGSDSSPLPEQPQSSKLLPQSVSSVRLFQSPTSNLQLQSQSQHSLFDPETLLSHNQLQLTPSPPSLSPNLPPRLLEPTPASRSAAYSGHRSPPINEDAPFFMYFTSVSGDHESAVSQKAAQCSQTVSSYQTEVFQNSPVAVKMDEEEELLMDSGDEISSDSLGLTPHEEESSDEEAHIHRHLMRGRCREKEQRNPGISHPDDPLVDAEKEEFQTNEQEQLSEPTMVIHRQSVGSGSEHFCDLKRFLPLGLDMNSSDSDAPEHRCPDSLHTSRTSMCGSKLGVLRSRSKAAQEIMEICRVDKTGCEDPNLDNDTTSHILNVLDQELKLMTKGTQDSLLVSGNSRSHIQHGNQHFTWGGVSEEQTDEEEAVQRDQQSVLLLP